MIVVDFMARWFRRREGSAGITITTERHGDWIGLVVKRSDGIIVRTVRMITTSPDGAYFNDPRWDAVQEDER